MGAIQDALTGFPLTAGARILEAILATSGVIAGVSGGITVGRMLGVDLGRLDPGFTSFSDLPVMALGAAITAGAFAFAAYAPLRSLVPIALIAGVAEVVFYTTFDRGLGVAWASAMASVLIGLVSYAVAARVRVPPAGDRGVLDRPAAARSVDLPRAVPALRGRQRPAVDHQRGRDRDRAGLRRDLRRVHRPAAQARGPAPRGPAVRPPAGRPAARAHRQAPHGRARPTRASGPRSRPVPAPARRCTSTRSTFACRGPSCSQATRTSTRSAGPSTCACTVPSGAFDTQPRTPRARASSWQESRKNTPCTRPCTTASPGHDLAHEPSRSTGWTASSTSNQARGSTPSYGGRAEPTAARTSSQDVAASRTRSEG